MAESMSREEYLKRYISGETDGKKKKRKKKVGVRNATMKIVDNTLSVDKFVGIADNVEDEVVASEETPQIVAVIDDRPEDVKVEERLRSGKWRRLNDNENNGFIKTEPNSSPKIKLEPKSPTQTNAEKLGIRIKEEPKSPPIVNAQTNVTIKEEPVSPSRQELGGQPSSGESSRNETRHRHDSDSDQTPIRRRYESDDDNSPPRRGRKRYDSDSDPSPPRKRRDDDLSPVRGRKRQSSSSDQSLPRHHRDEDLSPVRSSRKRHDSDSDQSPVRRRKVNDEDLSPPRSKRSKNADSDKDMSHVRKNGEPNEKLKKTLAGTKAGLSSAKDVRKELHDLRKREKDAFKNANDGILGRNAQTVFRDKEGKRRNLAKENEKDEVKRKQEEELKKKYALWNKGLVQQRKQDQNVKDAIHESKKEFARHKNDEDLEEYLKAQEREGDPMLKFIKKKKEKKTKKNKEPVRPAYKGPAPPINRFGILPGYRWDGVDRSNGFESELFKKANAREANEELGYRWATEDM